VVGEARTTDVEFDATPFRMAAAVMAVEGRSLFMADV